MILCEVCGTALQVITASHLRKHDLTTTAYKEHYGSSLVSPERIGRGLQSAFDWVALGLGKKPDSVIAQELEIKTRSVAYIRKCLRIPPFVGVILTQEGEPCRSVYEAMYDAWLHWRNIGHSHEVPIEGLPYKADFQVGDQFVEIVGMLNFIRYSQKYVKKRQAYERAGLRVTWLTADEVKQIYQGCEIALNIRSERVCSDCGKKTHDLVRGVCRICYMRRWHKSGRKAINCAYCGKQFDRNESTSQKYCSHKCYSRSLELEWPSWEWIDEQIETKSIRQVAFTIGVNPNALYMRLRRRRARNRLSVAGD